MSKAKRLNAHYAVDTIICAFAVGVDVSYLLLVFVPLWIGLRASMHPKT